MSLQYANRASSMQILPRISAAAPFDTCTGTAIGRAMHGASVVVRGSRTSCKQNASELAKRTSLTVGPGLQGREDVSSQSSGPQPVVLNRSLSPTPHLAPPSSSAFLICRK
ncbi:hypothetical protein J3F83DRAFT_209558 [Trichoderma novae-zelandiae]